MAKGGFEKGIPLLCCVVVVVCGCGFVWVTEGGVLVVELGV